MALPNSDRMLLPLSYWRSQVPSSRLVVTFYSVSLTGLCFPYVFLFKTGHCYAQEDTVPKNNITRSLP